MGRQSRARQQRRTKIVLGDAKVPPGFSQPVQRIPNMQQRVYYLNPRTGQIASVEAGSRISHKTGFLSCSLKTYREYRAAGAVIVPVTKQQPVVQKPKSYLHSLRHLAEIAKRPKAMARMKAMIGPTKRAYAHASA